MPGWTIRVWCLLGMGCVVEPEPPPQPNTVPPPTPESFDDDEDGLTNAEEEALGTDPTNYDTDGDTLSDGEEVNETLTSPLLVDTDADTYRDPDEIRMGFSPTNPNDRIYTGYWPFNPERESLFDPGFEDGQLIGVGSFFGRFRGTDWFGEQVDLYDFVSQDRLIVIEATGVWCEPSELTSGWFAGGFDHASLEPRFGAVRAAIDAGEMYWITVLVHGPAVRTPGDFDDVVTWHRTYPNDQIPVLTDDDRVLEDAINRISGSVVQFPYYAVLDASRRVLYRGDTEQVLQELTDRLEASAD